MFLQGMFLPWVCHLLPLLLFPVVQAGCSRGSAKWCKNAKFIPGHNLGGEGFDIITLKRKGAYVIDMESFLYSNGTCTLCENSLRKHKYQKLPLNILGWRVDFSCSLAVSSTIYESSLAFANAISSHIENDWRVGLAMPFLGMSVGVVTSGAHSKLSEFAMYHSSRDKYSFSSQEVVCRHYRGPEKVTRGDGAFSSQGPTSGTSFEIRNMHQLRVFGKAVKARLFNAASGRLRSTP